MNNEDLLLKTNSGVFSYRIAGVLIRDGKILIHHALGDTAYSLPGGHVAFGETSHESLVREFKEEMGADISIERLLWIQENFWKWGVNDCHQICLYYLIKLCDETQIPLDGTFSYQPQLEKEKYKLEFTWIELEKLKDMEFYPPFAKEKVLNLSDNIEHFIVKQ
jgi:ADP-ribose pyrophosphatase